MNNNKILDALSFSFEQLRFWAGRNGGTSTQNDKHNMRMT